MRRASEHLSDPRELGASLHAITLIAPSLPASILALALLALVARAIAIVDELVGYVLRDAQLRQRLA